MTIEALTRFLSPLKRRIMSMVGRCVIVAIDDSKGLQKLAVQILDDEIATDVTRFQQYGLTSHPMDGAEALVLAMGGNREQSIVIAIDDRRFRLKPLAKGEVALYTDEGDKIHLKRGNEIEIQTDKLTVTGAAEINLTAPDVKINCTNAEIIASAAVDVTAPTVNVTAATGVNMTTPTLTVSGLVVCSGIAAGGATPEAGKAKVTGAVEASGNISDSGGSMAAMRATYNGHTHPENGAGGGTTSAPNQSM